MVLVLMKILHLLATVAFIGGMVYFFIVNLSLKELDSNIQGKSFRSILENFIPFIWLNIAIILATGGFIIFDRLDKFIDDFRSSFSYEMLWVAKLSIATIVILLTTWISFRFKRNLESNEESFNRLFPASLKSATLVNIGLAFAVLFVVVLLQENYITLISAIKSP